MPCCITLSRHCLQGTSTDALTTSAGHTSRKVQGQYVTRYWIGPLKVCTAVSDALFDSQFCKEHNAVVCPGIQEDRPADHCQPSWRPDSALLTCWLSHCWKEGPWQHGFNGDVRVCMASLHVTMSLFHLGRCVRPQLSGGFTSPPNVRIMVAVRTISCSCLSTVQCLS